MKGLNKETLDKWQSVATIISLIFIPIFLTVMGFVIQSSISNQSIKKDYVQIATGILSDSKTTSNPDLRKWAADVLSKNSPVPFNQSLKNQIVGNAYAFSSAAAWLTPARPAIPGDLLQPPKAFIKPFSEHVMDNQKIAEDNYSKMIRLQSWVMTYYAPVGVAEIKKYLFPNGETSLNTK